MADISSGTTVPQTGRRSDGEVPLRVFGCSRLGLQANPPEVRGPLSLLRWR